jgi:tetratricopeptide (TPR) repeat protein
MSRGFAALASNAPEEAEIAFQQALALKPDSPEASSALEQTVSQMTLSAINIHLDAASAFENQEQWQQAFAEYDEALTIDPNLVSAREGKSRANSRNNLDSYLDTINNDPLRLAENAVYQQAVSIYNEAAKIEGNWTRLNDQLLTLRNFIERATEPVPVQIQSDGLTDITVYQVGNLGLIANQTLSLTPGTYVAVGIRAGFRDVREEFVVGFDGQSPVITVQCVEEIL